MTDGALRAIIARSQGNPLFALELTEAVQGGSVDDLPDSVEKVISSRLDDLAPDHRLVVRIAAVFGTTFDRDDVNRVIDQEVPGLDIDQPALHGILEQRGGSRLGFRHALYRDVAYEGLPFRRRRALHRTVGESIESSGQDRATASALLSVHFAAAKVRDKAWRYSLAAADAAAGAGANLEAAAALQRALANAPGHVTRSQKAATLERLGDVSWVGGDLAAASSAYRRARTYAEVSLDDLRLRRKVGTIREREGRQSTALRWYNAALRDTPEGRDGLAERAQLLLAQAGIMHRQGDNVACAALAREAQSAAEQAQDTEALALAHDRQALAAAFLNEPDTEGHGEEALRLWRELGNTTGEARVLNNMGIAAYFRGDWTEASDRYAAAVERSQAAGDVIEAGVGALNQAEILADQGHYDRAATVLDDVVRNWSAMSYGPGVAVALSFRGTARARAGRLDAARNDLEEALERSQAIGAGSLIAGSRLRLAELALLADDRHGAEAQVHQLREMPEAAQQDIGRRLRLLRALLDLDERPDEAREALEEIGASGGDFDQALALWALTPVEESALARSLGIVAFPAYPALVTSA